MTAFTNLGDLIPRERDLAKIAIIDLGGEQSAARTFTFAATRRHGERRRARARASAD